ncbi:type IV pilin protein [Rubrivivax rivuli]|uniref:Prepilin-type N-terminal cleavage/methylation domain-containing protein n=1 Tax=Rubrivivax rivuli TaxID=1862385 RepID=A0A437RCE6_9BURK|nr:type IV pilin protein [Rubrivivax rivuli]RVU44456.1 prepilin-type N-terminal cleavage/methylation domain-containing protein [Rubrivivax rivuli]
MTIAPFQARSKTQGFTLIELMIAVAIVAIITAIALPAYQASITKSRRADAMTAFSSVQQAQERWRGNNPAYSTSLTDLGVTSPALYTLSLSVPNSTAGSIARGYIVTAVGQGRQASDAQCARMAIRLLEGNLRFAGCGTCSSFADADFAATHPCFNR